MKRWAIFTVAIYAIALLLLTAPAILIAFGGWARAPYGMSDVVKVYSSNWYWIWLAVLMAGQTMFLLVPIDIAERRLPARRPIGISVIVTALFLTNIFASGLLSIVLAIWKEDALDVLQYLSPSRYLTRFTIPDSETAILQGMVVCLFIFWILWALVFRTFANSDDPDAFVNRSVRWLLRGSILELLIAIPSHIIVRRRGDCCAPVGTFWGIASGISVMLLCFGPGVFYLFVERFRRLQPKGVRK